MFESTSRSRLYGGATTNFELIKQTATDIEGKRSQGDHEYTTPQCLHTKTITHRTVWVVELLPLLLLIAVPLSVHAGVFSILWSSSTPAAEVIENPQTTRASDVRLLSAHNSPDPAGALGGGDLIVDAGALVSSGQFGDDVIEKTSASAGEISVYTVRAGDTLSQIAEMFEVTTNTILWANDIERASSIQPGDTLVILPIVGVRHIVKEGDTISSIATKYEGDVSEILSYNQLASADDLVVGATVVVPGGNLSQPTPKTVARSSGPVKTTGSAGSSSLTHPVPGAVRTQGIHGYNGVDLAAAVGTPVRAAASGEVIISKSGGWNGGYGNYIVIKHSNGTQTLYAHLSRNDVGVGAFVGAAETIGAVGNTGRSTGSHLHFEVRGAANPF